MVEEYFENTIYPCIKKYQTKLQGNGASTEDGGPFIVSLIMEAIHCNDLTRGKVHYNIDIAYEWLITFKEISCHNQNCTLQQNLKIYKYHGSAIIAKYWSIDVSHVDSTLNGFNSWIGRIWCISIQGVLSVLFLLGFLLQMVVVNCLKSSLWKTTSFTQMAKVKQHQSTNVTTHILIIHYDYKLS